MTSTQVQKREASAAVTNPEQEAQAIQAQGMYSTYLPDVDICEDSEHVRLVADMPGVDQASVNVTVENNVLTIEGQAQVVKPEGGYELVGREYGTGRYRRDFTLSDMVSAEGVKARMNNGVLEVTIPKREAAKTRRIKIET